MGPAPAARRPRRMAAGHVTHAPMSSPSIVSLSSGPHGSTGGSAEHVGSQQRSRGHICISVGEAGGVMLNNMAELMSDCGYSEAIRLCDLEMGRQKYGIFIFIFDSFYIYLFRVNI